MANLQSQKFLIIGPSWVGDMVMAQSLFKELRKTDPQAIIDVVGPAWSSPILARMPEVRHSIVLPTGHGEWGLSTRRDIGKQLRAEAYDIAITLPRSWKSALIPFFAKIPKRIGFHGEARYWLLNERRKLDKNLLNQTVKRFVSLGLPLNAAYPPKQIEPPALTVDLDHQNALMTQLGLNPEKPALALMAGAEYGPSKQWPLEYFAEVAQHATQQGYQVWIIGGPKDQSNGEYIIKDMPVDAFNLCGKTSLVDAIDLLAKAEVAISNDSGLMHIAAAVGTHIHAIYGSTSEIFTPPLTDNKTIHNLHLECSPCFKRTCPLEHTNCQKQLMPLNIIQMMDASHQ